ncbi:MAG: FAD-binding oxidoreductase [Thermoplasmata archaeon]|nr:FAD-binding oxidoreductase [Thermoplasmata archaeon]
MISVDRVAVPVRPPFDEVRKALGSDRVAIGEDVHPGYRLDAFREHRGSSLPENGVLPAAVVWPRGVEDVVAVVRFAREHDVAVVPWGGGTGLMGGARPTWDSIVVDMRRMRRVRSIDRVSCTVTAEAGIVLEALDRRLRKRGLTLGHDPWSRPRATLGGAIGTNGIGYAGYLRGTMGDQVLGLEAVLADGAVLRTRAAVRSTTGFDLKRLFIGTEGTFGIVTAATLRAFPVPEREEIHAFSLRDFAGGLRSLARVYDAGLVPSVMDLEESFGGSGLPWRSEAGPPELYLGFAGAKEVVAASWRVAQRELRSVRARPRPDAEARGYWRTRHEIIYFHDEVAPGVTRADVALKEVIFDYVHVALPRSKVLAFRRGALATVRRHGVNPLGFGLWTQPELVSLEVVRRAGTDRAAAKAAVAAAVDETIRQAQALGGSMEYVHGVGVKLAHLLEEELGTGLSVMRKMKTAMDPKETLNPGKVGL